MSRNKLSSAIAAAAVLTLIGAASWVSARQAAPVHPLAAAAPAAKPPVAASKPLWKDLTKAQQAALAPLAAEWDKMEAERKPKWLEIAKNYSSMKPEEQQRAHERMRDWLKLTPDERRVARENYQRTKKIDPSQKTVQWEQYQQLPDEQKKKLAAEAATKKQVANLPSKAQASVKTVAPIKSGAAPVPCPAGSVKNPAASMPACVPAPAAAPVAAPATVPASAPSAPPPATPVAPASNVKQ